MFQFLLVLFIISPTGEVASGTKPYNTIEACRAEAQTVINKATHEGLLAVGRCVPRSAFQGNS
jgi:hypothetical protein